VATGRRRPKTVLRPVLQNGRMDDRTCTADAEPGDTVTVAGWVHEVRDLGGIAFLILRDTTGKIQVKFEKDEMDEDLVETGLNVQRESVIAVTGDVEEEPAPRPASRLRPTLSTSSPRLTPNSRSTLRQGRRRTLHPPRQPHARPAQGRDQGHLPDRAEVLRAVREEFRGSAARRSTRRRSSPPVPRAAPSCSRSPTSARRRS